MALHELVLRSGIVVSNVFLLPTPPPPPARLAKVQANVDKMLQKGLMKPDDYAWWKEFIDRQEKTDWFGTGGECVLVLSQTRYLGRKSF